MVLTLWTSLIYRESCCKATEICFGILNLSLFHFLQLRSTTYFRCWVLILSAFFGGMWEGVFFGRLDSGQSNNSQLCVVLLFWDFDQGITMDVIYSFYTYCMPEVHTLLTPEECPETCDVFSFSLLRKTFGFYTAKWLGLADRRPLDLPSSNEEMQSISNVVYGEAFPCLALLISILVKVEVWKDRASWLPKIFSLRSSPVFNQVRSIRCHSVSLCTVASCRLFVVRPLH